MIPPEASHGPQRCRQRSLPTNARISKLRPAVVLAEIIRDDFVLCQVTSNPYADPHAIELSESSFAEGSLQRISYARPGKLFTANLQLFEGEAGVLQEHTRGQIVEEVVQLLKDGAWGEGEARA